MYVLHTCTQTRYSIAVFVCWGFTCNVRHVQKQYPFSDPTGSSKSVQDKIAFQLQVHRQQFDFVPANPFPSLSVHTPSYPIPPLLSQNFRYKGSPPPIIFAKLGQWMPYNFAADSFHTKKLCSRLSSSEVHFLIEIGRFAFLRPPLGDLGATYDDHLRLIGKSIVVGPSFTPSPPHPSPSFISALSLPTFPPFPLPTLPFSFPFHLPSPSIPLSSLSPAPLRSRPLKYS